jgi:hypothetical protein
MEHAMRKLPAIVALGTVLAAPASAQQVPNARHGARGLPSSGCWNDMRNVD